MKSRREQIIILASNVSKFRMQLAVVQSQLQTAEKDLDKYISEVNEPDDEELSRQPTQLSEAELERRPTTIFPTKVNIVSE